MKYLNTLLRSKQTCFKTSELGLLWGVQNKHTLKNILQRLQKDGLLLSAGFGIRTLPEYDLLEFASKIRAKSYISLETVLQKEGIIFQDYSNTITLVSNNSLKSERNGTYFEFSKIKDSILTNPLGIKNTGKYMIASKERAICDRMYLTPGYYFDNLSHLNIELMEELSTIYNKTTSFKIKKIIHGLG